MKDYAALLAHSYAMESKFHDMERSRKEWLSEYVFDFTTYDSEMSELFATKALEVCAAISDGKTFGYIAEREGYRWYLIMINMPFFQGRLNWGTSIRGAWWDVAQQSGSNELACDLWEGETQVLRHQFTQEEWLCFVKALIAFGSGA